MTRVEGDKKIGNTLGRLGEDIACRFLENKYFEIIDRNYRKKCGEIDIVAIKDLKVHFIEIKSKSFKFKENDVTHETSNKYRAEENIHRWKIERLKRVIQLYIQEKRVSPETSWYFDVVIVKIDSETKKSIVIFLEDVVI